MTHLLVGLDDDAFQAVERVKDDIGAKEHADVIRFALAFYYDAVEHWKDGGRPCFLHQGRHLILEDLPGVQPREEPP